MSEADDDDISITSTAPSEQQSEYDVEKILAEVVVEGETKYLVKWANYPIERSNPEPKESFSNSETLETWEKEKRLIREGKREPFDLVAFDEQVEAAEQAKTDRKRRREAKRRRLGSGGRAELPQRDSRKPAPQSRPRPSSIATRPAPNSRILANGAVRSVADKPPMALFGNPRAAPTSGNRFQKKSSTQELSKIFNLSTKRKYEKAKSYEPAPDVNKLDLRRPSEWDSRSTIAARLGDRPSKPLAESQSTVVAKQSDGIVNPDPGSSAVTENHVTGSDGMDDLTSGKESASNQPFPLPQRGPRWNHLRVGDYWCNWGELLIHLFYGPEKIEIGPTRICGLASESIRKRLLDTKKSRRFDLWFQHVCTAEEYRLLRRESLPDEEYCSGWVEGFDDSEPRLYRLGHTLQQKGLVAIHYPENKSQDVLLAYSPNSSIYDLIRSPNCPDTAFLGITVRNALAAPIRAREIHRKQPVNPPPTLENPNLDAIFEEQFKIKFEDLATVQSPKKVRAEQAFYLMFPVDNEAAQEEFQVVVEFLKYDGRDLAIYSNRDPQDWRKFIGTTQSGVVLFHETFMDYHTLRDFMKAINGPFNLWTVSLANPLQFVDRRGAHFQRIFPYGRVILLTEDFMTRESQATVIILAWFQELSQKKFPGSWKLMLRPNVLDWLLTQQDRADKIKSDRFALMYQLILQTNTRRFCPGESEYGVDNIYEDFNNANIISPKKLPGYDNAPTPRKEADHLIELFAGWALANCTKFRRFVALTTVTPEPRWKTWNHLEVSDVETFLKIHQIDCARLWHELGLTGELNVKLSAASVSSAAARDQRSQNTSTSTFTPRTPNLGTPRELDAVRRAPSVKGGGGGGCRGSGSSYPQPYR